MNMHRMLQHTMRIQAVPAPTFSEGQRGELMADLFAQIRPLQLEMDVAGNVLVQVIEGQSDAIVVTAHMDSVFQAGDLNPAVIKSNRLTGPGVGDNAIALAALLELAEDLPHRPAKRAVWLVANVAEEGLGNLLGMEHVLERFGTTAAAYIVLEGMALGHIYNQGLPVRRYRLRVETEGGHAWIHAGRSSAIHHLIRISSDLLSLPLDRFEASLNLGVISGGRSVNSIAAQADIEFEIRSPYSDKLAKLSDTIESTVKAAASQQVKTRLEVIGQRPGGLLSSDHPLIAVARQAAADAGLDEPVLASASTDASLPISLGLPAICVGLTRGGNAHSVDEFIEIEPLAKGYEALLNLILLAAGSEHLEGD